MTLDKNARHLLANGVGLTLVLMALAVNIIVAVLGNDQPFGWVALLVLLDCLLAAWFTCGIFAGLRRRYPATGGATR